MYYTIEQKDKTKTYKNWFFKINDPQTNTKMVIEYKQRKLYIYDLEHPNVITGSAIYYKDKLVNADIVFKNYNNKQWFGEIMDRVIPRVMKLVKKNVRAFEKQKMNEFYEKDRKDY